MLRKLLIILLLITTNVYAAGPYYVATDGDDGEDGTTPAKAFATLEKAMDTLDDGETCYVEMGTYTDQDGANDSCLYIDDAGVAGSPITWIGIADLNDTSVYGMVKVDASSGGLANAVETTGALGSVYHTFKYFNFSGASGDCFEMGTDDAINFEYCAFTSSSGGWGLDGDDQVRLFGCLAQGNDSGGIQLDNYTIVYGIVSRSNTGLGIYVDTGSSITQSLFNDNGTVQVRINGTHISLNNNTIDGGDAADGIHNDNGSDGRHVYTCNIIVDCTTGMYSDFDSSTMSIFYHNMFYSNTDDVGVNMPDVSDQEGSFIATENPFSSGYALANNTPNAGGKDGGISAIGSKEFWDDYNLGAGDTTPETGTDDLDIGSAQREEPASTGGRSAGANLGGELQE